MAKGGKRSRWLQGERILPGPIRRGMRVADLVEETFCAYNGARLREACRLFTRRMLEEDVTVGMSVTGALTPAGLGMSCLIPLVEAGFVDWVCSTGANLYHDAHHGIGLSLHAGNAGVDDRLLRRDGIIRIFDIFFHYDVLLSTDAFFREMIRAPEFQRPMSTAEFHHIAGRYVAERERVLGIGKRSFLAAAHRLDVPVYTSSPGDSSIGMNVAAMELEGNGLRYDVNADVNETASIVLDAKRRGGKSAVLIVGGGSPKNFVLQTEPQIQEVLGIDEKGHDFFLQMTDARPDTGGLSGATPSEAVSWGKIDPDMLPDTVVAYVDATVALPILTAYALSLRGKRPLKRLYRRRGAMLAALEKEAEKVRARRNRTGKKAAKAAKSRHHH